MVPTRMKRRSQRERIGDLRGTRREGLPQLSTTPAPD
jgi:hypothetical protein